VPGSSFAFAAQRTKLSRAAIATAAIAATTRPSVRTRDRSPSQASSRPPPTIATVPPTSPARSGSFRRTSANAVETSGAIPTSTAVLDAPINSIARTNSNCETPGATKPATANGHAE